jgi:hypothetical protein
MTQGRHVERELADEHAPDRRREVKREAVKRLLVWGFAPAVIAQMLGCDIRWIDAIGTRETNPERGMGERPWQAVG